MKISEQVESLEDDKRTLIVLCGEMLATLKVNFERGQCLASLSPKHQESFKTLINRWEERFSDVRNNDVKKDDG